MMKDELFDKVRFFVFLPKEKIMPKKTAKIEELLAQTHAIDGEKLVFEGIKVNNLKNIDLTLPKNKLITITGVS